MVSAIALNNFNKTWKLFENPDKGILDAGGSDFLIVPFKQFFSKEFAYNLTEESAYFHFHSQMEKWGQIEQNKHEIEIEDEFKLPDGKIIKKPRFKYPEVRWARSFIITVFYNLCCLGSHKQTIEELVYLATRNNKIYNYDEVGAKAFGRLIGISNSFLLSEWGQELISKAISNRNDDFFNEIKKKLNKNIPLEKFSVARAWIGTTMLWYLGGKDMKRLELLHLLKQMDIVSNNMDLPVFNAELYKLRLIKDLNITK